MPDTKVRVFIDFWNFQLTLNEVTSREYRPDWPKIPSWLVKRAAEITGQTLQFDGAHVYISYDPRSDKGRGLRNWATNTLDLYPGIQVILRERRPRGLPVCPKCHKEVPTCSHCGARMSRTIEKGIDTAIVTDLMKLAWEGAWRVAVLVSSDHDFVPVVELLADKGYQVINAHFPPKGRELARKCWATIDLRDGLTALERRTT